MFAEHTLSEKMILNELGLRGSPTFNFALVLLLLMMPEGGREYVDTSKGKDKS